MLLVRYLLKELIPQFLSALIIVCAIIVVSQLVRLSEVLVNFGISLENVFLPFLYITMPFLSLTIPMAFLFAVVLTFGRLSADGEYPGLLAAGYSLKRAAKPVMIVAVLLYGIGTTCALYLEPWGRRELVQFLYRKTQTELDNMVKYKMQPGVFLSDFLGYTIYAEHISSDRAHFENVLLAPGNPKQGDFTMLAPTGHIAGSVETGDLRLTLDYGVAYAAQPGGRETSILTFHRAEIDLLRIFQDQILGADVAQDDYRSYPPAELWEYVQQLAAKPSRDALTETAYRRATLLLHQRIAMPFAAVTFALFGMVLGVSDPRRGKSSAYLGAVGTIVAGFIVMKGFEWLGQNGYMPQLVAAWLPNILLLLFGGFLVYQKNRLPPSEPTLARENLPVFGRRRIYKAQ